MRYDHIGFTEESNSAIAKFGESNALSVLSKSWLYQIIGSWSSSGTAPAKKVGRESSRMAVGAGEWTQSTAGSLELATVFSDTASGWIGVIPGDCDWT